MTETSDPLAWVRAHQKLVLGIAAAVVIVALGTWVVIETGQRRELKAAEALDQARNIAESGNLPLAASELQKLIETFDGTNAAIEAVVTLNQVRMVNGQSQLAVVSLQDYLKTNPKKVYKVPAQGLLGEALENAGKPAEAGGGLHGRRQGRRVDYLKAQYLMSAARAYGERRERDRGGQGAADDRGQVPEDHRDYRGQGPAVGVHPGQDDARQVG